MANCSKCGFKLPEGAVYCPNCGAPVKRFQERHVTVIPAPPVASLIRLGILGTLLSITISMFTSSVDLYFLPSFISSLAVIFFSRTNRFRDAMIIAMTTYLFTDAIAAGLTLGYLYAFNEPLASLYGNYVPTLLDVLMYSISPITAIIASYIGSKLSLRGREEVYVHGEEKRPSSTVVYSLKNAFKKFKYVLICSYTRTRAE